MLLYSLLHLFGYGLTLDDLRELPPAARSKTPGHPEYGDTPGVELTTGPLGQGFAHGVGMALAARATRARFGARRTRGPAHHFVYGIVSDGDLMEGDLRGGGLARRPLGLGNLIYLYDDNHITIDGPTSLRFIGGRRRGASRRSAGTSRRWTARTWRRVDAALDAARAEPTGRR